MGIPDASSKDQAMCVSLSAAVIVIVPEDGEAPIERHTSIVLRLVLVVSNTILLILSQVRLLPETLETLGLMLLLFRRTIVKSSKRLAVGETEAVVAVLFPSSSVPVVKLEKTIAISIPLPF